MWGIGVGDSPVFFGWVVGWVVANGVVVCVVKVHRATLDVVSVVAVLWQSFAWTAMCSCLA